MNKVVFISPFLLTVLALTLVLWANKVIRFNKEQFYFAENDTLKAINDKTVNKEYFWNLVSDSIKRNPLLGKSLGPRKQRYFERKVEVGVSALITTVALLILLAISIFVIVDNSRNAPIPRWLIISLSAVVASTFPILLWKCNPITDEGPVNYLASLVSKYGDRDSIDIIGQGVAVLAATSVAVLVFACCCLLNKAGDLHRKIYQSKLLLGISTVALASGVLTNYFFHSWSVAVVQESDQLISLANVLTINVGMLFTFLLLILFTPVALFHQYWLSQSNKNTQTAIEWKTVLREFLTCIIPIIVAVVAQWLGYKD
jgi:hypothetical protein